MSVNAFNPFQEIASGMARNTEEGFYWEEEPVDIVTFVEDKRFLNQKWDGRRGCRPKIKEVIKNVIKSHVRESILLLGKGAGKDYLSSIIHLYGIYKSLCMSDPQAYYKLSPGSPIYFVNTARNDTQAKKVFFTQFKGLLENCLWFRGKYQQPTSAEVRFDKGITALSANSQAYGWLGYNTIQWVGDELAFFLENDQREDSESRAEECWEAAFGSCKTRFPKNYKMIGITTPRYDDDFVMNKFVELSSRPDGYVAKGATWDMNPNLTKEDFRHRLTMDYRRTMRDFGAEPMGMIDGFWNDPDFIEDNVCEECRQCEVYQNRNNNRDDYICRTYDECFRNPYLGNGKFAEWFVPESGVEYYMHFDLSKNKDRLAFCMGHVADIIQVKLDEFAIHEKFGEEKNEVEEDELFVEKSLINIDLLSWIDPRSHFDVEMLRNKEIHYDSIYKKLIVSLKDKGFNIVKISFDQFQSVYIKQRIDDLGIETELLSTDRTDEIPNESKEAFIENRVNYPYVRMLCREAKNLIVKKGNKVDHPPGGSKDAFDSVSCVIHSCDETVLQDGLFEILNEEDD